MVTTKSPIERWFQTPTEAVTGVAVAVDVNSSFFRPGFCDTNLCQSNPSQIPGNNPIISNNHTKWYQIGYYIASFLTEKITIRSQIRRIPLTQTEWIPAPQEMIWYINIYQLLMDNNSIPLSYSRKWSARWITPRIWTCSEPQWVCLPSSPPSRNRWEKHGKKKKQWRWLWMQQKWGILLENGYPLVN